MSGKVIFKGVKMTPVLLGDIVSVPLEVEDAQSHKLIKESTLYVHSVVEDDILSMTTLITEGTFQVKLDRAHRLGVRKIKNELLDSDEKWDTILLDLLAGKNSGIADGLVIVGRYLTNSKNYDEDGEYIEVDEDEDEDGGCGGEGGRLSIAIKTSNVRIPVTLGSVGIDRLSEEEMVGKDETNFLNWLDLLIKNHRESNDRVRELREANKKLVQERDYYRKEVNLAASESNNILKDFEYKFYKVLNAKKDKIWELEGNAGGDPLEGLNAKYVEENEFNLNNTELDLATIPGALRDELVDKKRRKDAEKGKKRRRLNQEEEEAKEDGIKVKVEPETDSKIISEEKEIHGTETDMEDKVKIEEEIDDSEMEIDSDSSGMDIMEKERLQKKKQVDKFIHKRFTNRSAKPKREYESSIEDRSRIALSDRDIVAEVDTELDEEEEEEQEKACHDEEEEDKGDDMNAASDQYEADSDNHTSDNEVVSDST